ncbi:MAG: Acetate kinase [Myxococcales bacterium]|nr:Acetate kinase [Myxococcales bacterium]
MKESLILAVNCGSSSLKLALFRFDGDAEARIAEGAIEGIGLDRGRAWLKRDAGKGSAGKGSAGEGSLASDQPIACADHAAAITAALALFDPAELAALTAVGHRIVHGGPEHDAPHVIDAALVEGLRRITPFAPLHLPVELRTIEAVSSHFPALPQVACFDTAFHRTLPEVARRFPLARSFRERGLHRYGFHGLSYEFLVESLGARTLGRAVLAHLGNGASMAAVRDGKSADTTMGLTPTGGFMMGTRSGDLDPGLLLHLLNDGYDAPSLERLVNHEAGLLGVSGSTSDMKLLLERRATDPDATFAVELFCHQARKSVGALAATLGGLDSLVFTGGIGERAAPVRALLCDGLAFLGVQLDAARNAASAPIISVDGSACTVRVVPTDEERMIARQTRRTLAPA